MAILTNGLQTLEIGQDNWVDPLNDNFTNILTSSEFALEYNKYSLKTHNHDTLFFPVVQGITATHLSDAINKNTNRDISFSANKGIVLEDNTNTSYRLFVDNAELFLENVGG